MIFLNKKFPHFPQIEFNDCGITCLQIIIKYYGKECDLSYLRQLCNATKTGISAFDIKRISNEIGFECEAIKTSINGIIDLVNYPCILHWEQNHFLVLYKYDKEYFHLSDPNYGRIKLKIDEFKKFWLSKSETGIAILLNPTSRFYSFTFPCNDKKVLWKNLKIYLRKILSYQQKQMYYLFALLLLGGGLSYIYPLSIEYLVDKGLSNKNLHLIGGILLFQLFLSIGGLLIEALKGVIRIRIQQKVSINIFKDLLGKLIALPLSYFDNRKTADILQKIEEQKKIETFITENLFNFSISFFLLLAFTLQIFLKNTYIGLIFMGGTLLSFLCFLSFSRQRNTLNYYNLKLNAENRNFILETVKGIIPIKLFNAQENKIKYWIDLQEKIVELRKRILKNDTNQLLISNFINQLKTVFINFYCCLNILKGSMTIGEMVAIGAILGVLNSPIQNIYNLIRSYVDSILSFQKINEIFLIKSEDDSNKTHNISIHHDISFNNVSFGYNNTLTLLNNVSFRIMANKTTAIVGESGSGKTTITKLLGKFYNCMKGDINYGSTNIDELNVREWRAKIGIVSQDGYIFSGSITENIALNISKENVELGALNRTCKIACIYDFITTLPLGYDTIIGDSGIELSAGQRQRILIARALYSDPEIIIFDEATSNLDSITEAKILDNLTSFLLNRTVVIVAHRLSTVQQADHIIALKDGTVMEEGNHFELLTLRGYYHKLWLKQTLKYHEEARTN